MVGNGGAKLKPAEVKAYDQSPKALGPDGKPRPMMMFKFDPGGGVSITAPSASIDSLVGLMSRFTARPVVDMTRIEGQYDFRLTFARETAPLGPPKLGASGEPNGSEVSAEPAVSVFDAVKQYGLRLDARKAPLEMLTITHLEKTPTEN
jgi:uncharacterized protein (TIGR03435 family)